MLFLKSSEDIFWPVCSPDGLLAWRANRPTRKPAWPIQWMLWRVNRNEAEMLEWRPVIRPADLLTFIKWNCAIPSHNLKDFYLPRQINFIFANLWSFPTIFCSSVLVRQNSCAEEFNSSVGEADKWGIQAWSWFLSIFAIGRDALKEFDLYRCGI